MLGCVIYRLLIVVMIICAIKGRAMSKSMESEFHALASIFDISQFEYASLVSEYYSNITLDDDIDAVLLSIIAIQSGIRTLYGECDTLEREMAMQAERLVNKLAVRHRAKGIDHNKDSNASDLKRAYLHTKHSPIQYEHSILSCTQGTASVFRNKR